MKKLLLLALVLINMLSYGQYCGNSGSSVCSPSGVLSQPGLHPATSDLPPLLNGNTPNVTIQFKNFDKVYFSNMELTVNWLRFDSITNLPDGTCWSSNKVDNTFSNSEDGCIKLSNIPCDATGQYKLNFFVTVSIVGLGELPFTGDQAGMKYFLRVINPGQTALAVDTNQVSQFVAYGPSAVCSATNLVASLGSNSSVCPNTQVTTTANVSGGAAPYTYTWSATGTTITCTTCSTQIAALNNQTTYNLTVTDANNVSVTSTVTYNIIPTGSADLFATPQTLCEGDTATLATTQTGTYNWSTGATTATIQAWSQNTYSLTITDNAGCIYQASLLLQIGANPSAANIVGDVTVDPFSVNAYTVSNDPNIEYSWIVQGGVIQSGQNSNSVNIQWGANGPYSLSLVQLNNADCSTITSINITENSGTGIANAHSKLAMIYPNPSTREVYIETTSATAQITVSDIAGRTLNSEITSIGTGKYSISFATTGIYFINTIVNGQANTQRVIIVH